MSNIDYLSNLKSNLEAMKKHLQQMIDDLLEEGKYYADWYWNYVASMREETKEYAKFGTRVRLNKETFVAEWYINHIVKNYTTGGGRIFSKQIPKGKGYSYNPNSFIKNEPLDWELEMIIETEKHYTTLRKRAERVQQIKSKIKLLEKQIAQEEKELSAT